MGSGEEWIRALLLLPLAVITLQIVLLGRLLRSPAWSLLSWGFVVFLVVRGVTLFMMPTTRAALLAMLVGYTLVAAGFYTLRTDLLRILRPFTPPQVPRNRRAEDAPR
jgi:amino acid permease